MTAPNKSIAPLTKVVLACATQPLNTTMPLAGPNFEFGFVFGLGTQGLTEFEMRLTGKQTGDRITIPVTTNTPTDFFEHLWSPLAKVLKIDPPFDLHVSITSVNTVTDRELVSALVQKTEDTGCSCDGGCGCSC